MVKRPRGDEQAQPDDLGNDPGQVGSDSAGQSGDPQNLSSLEGATNESVQELADTDQAFEADVVDGIEDAADHPERPVHTHLDYGRPDDLSPDHTSELDDELPSDERAHRTNGEATDIDVEDLSDEDVA
jgi:hypothetical protein